MDVSSRAAVMVFTVLLPVFPAAGFAQEDEPVLEEVRVIGTHIPRRDYVSPSPVFTVEREAIAIGGTVTMAEYLNRFPQFRPDWGETSNNPGNGTARLNLRGLGAARTLVLLDGQRMGPAGPDSVVDINAIPTALIERVEILTGGVSATYGSDAIAGAVNFHLRRDFEGLEIQAGYQVTDAGDGDTGDITLSAGTGFADGRGRISGFVGYTDREEIFADARDFSAVPLQNDFGTGELYPGGSNNIPDGRLSRPAIVDGEFAPRGIIFEPDGSVRPYVNEDAFNYQPYSYLLTPLERVTAGAFTQFDFSATLRGHVDLLWNRNEVEQALAPSPWPGIPAQLNLDNPALNEQSRRVIAENYAVDDNGLVTVPLSWRSEVLGSRTADTEIEAYRVNLGLEGQWFDDWHWRANYLYSRSDSEVALGGAIDGGRLRQGLLVDPATGQCYDSSGGCVPVNVFGLGNLSPEAAAYIDYSGLANDIVTEQQVASFVTSGGLSPVGNYRFDIALGAEWRLDESRFTPDPELASSGQVGFGASPAVGGDIEVWELFAEAVFPLLEDRTLARSLQLELGYRYSDYSTAGDTDTYKTGLLWQPVDSVTVRTMFQRAVRAPNISDLYTAQSEFFGIFEFFFDVDPCAASQDPVGNGYRDLCVAQGIPPELLGVFENDPFAFYTGFEGGEQELTPEEADTFTFGLTWLPEFIENFSIAVDYYDIEIENAINGTDEREVLNLCFLENDPNSRYCQGLRRGPDLNISEVDLKLQNIGELSTEGIDLQLDYQLGLGSVFGQPSSLSLQLVLNHVMDHVTQTTSQAPRYACVGYFGFPCETVPEYRANTRLAWQLGDVVAELNWQWIDAMDSGLELALGAAYIQPLDTGSYDLFDLDFSWAISEQLQVYAGISNLTDEDPPILGGFGSEQSNTDPRQYDVLGRRYHASLVWRFR